MTNTDQYCDKRSKFFSTFFEKGLSFDAYLQSGTPAQQKKWNDFASRILLHESQKVQLAAFTRRMNVLIMSGIWCGDCARQGPMFAALENAANVITCRFIDNREHPDLQDELRVLGGQRVPVVVILSEDFFEVERFGDRTLASYRRKAQTELGPACDAGLVGPGSTELQAEITDWLAIFERCQLMLRLAPALRERYKD